MNSFSSGALSCGVIDMISFKRLARKIYVLYCTNATSVPFTVAKLTSCISVVKHIQSILFNVSEGKFWGKDHGICRANRSARTIPGKLHKYSIKSFYLMLEQTASFHANSSVTVVCTFVSTSL